MKLNCGPSYEQRRAEKVEALKREIIRLRDWHDWFAWFPVRVAEGDCRWLEVVERQMQGTYYTGYHIARAAAYFGVKNSEGANE